MLITDIRRGVLVERRDQYRKAALAAKRGGDNNKARQYAKVAKVIAPSLRGIISFGLVGNNLFIESEYQTRLY